MSLVEPIDQNPEESVEIHEARLRREGEERVVKILEGYRSEADQARRGGPNPRDEKWDENLDLYWSRYDFSQKEPWQAKVVMPDIPSFVDRFAAAMKEALVAVPEGFYVVNDPADAEGDMADAIKKMTDVWLSRCGHAMNGHYLAFPAVFEEQTKLGALMACCATVNWREDHLGGRVAIEAQDPRRVWFDHTGRGLYRIRRIEMDRHNLARTMGMKDKSGKSVFNMEAYGRFHGGSEGDDKAEREDLTGHGQQTTSSRNTVYVDEYIATVVAEDGEVLANNALGMVLEQNHLVRGMDPNPFWHGRDWLVYTPLITTPLSVYGRSYMEDFGSVAVLYNQVTNLLLDSARMAGINAFLLVKEFLVNPQQVTTLGPNQVLEVEPAALENVIREIELGRIPPELFQIWQGLKGELREIAGVNEIGLGQFAPKSRTSATEIAETQHASSALVRSIAQTVEDRFLSPVLDLTWRTGLQFMNPNDRELREAAGPEMFQSIVSRREEFARHPASLRANGLSWLIQRQQELQGLIQILQLVAQSEPLLAQFLKVVSLEKLVERLMRLNNVDMSSLSLSERERKMQEIAEQVPQVPGQPNDQAPQGAPEENQAAALAGGLELVQ